MAHPRDPRVGVEGLRYRHRPASRRLDPEGKGREPPLEQPRSLGVEAPAGALAPLTDGIQRPGRAQHRSGEQVRVAAEELGRGVHDGIDPELQRPGEDRRGEGGVDDHARVRGPRERGDGAEIRDAKRGVADRLEPDEPRAGGEGSLEAAGVGGGEGEGLDAEIGEGSEQVGRAAVELARHRHRTPWGAQAEQGGVDRGHAGAEQQTALGALQVGEVLLHRRDRGAAVARIDEGLVPAARVGQSRAAPPGRRWSSGRWAARARDSSVRTPRPVHAARPQAVRGRGAGNGFCHGGARRGTRVRLGGGVLSTEVVLSAEGRCETTLPPP